MLTELEMNHTEFKGKPPGNGGYRRRDTHGTKSINPGDTFKK